MKGKKPFYILALSIVVVGLILFAIFLTNMNQIQPTQAERRAEQIILSYIAEKNLNIKLGTHEYQTKMKGILLGEYPDLTSKNSPFVKNDAERDYVIDYAANHMK